MKKDKVMKDDNDNEDYYVDDVDNDVDDWIRMTNIFFLMVNDLIQV